MQNTERLRLPNPEEIEAVLRGHGVPDETVRQVRSAIEELDRFYPRLSQRELEEMAEIVAAKFVKEHTQFTDGESRRMIRKKLRDLAILIWQGAVQNVSWNLMVYLFLKITGWLAGPTEDELALQRARERSAVADGPLPSSTQETLGPDFLETREGLEAAISIQGMFWDRVREKVYLNPAANEIIDLLRLPSSRNMAFEVVFDALKWPVLDAFVTKLKAR